MEEVQVERQVGSQVEGQVNGQVGVSGQHECGLPKKAGGKVQALEGKIGKLEKALAAEKAKGEARAALGEGDGGKSSLELMKLVVGTHKGMDDTHMKVAYREAFERGPQAFIKMVADLEREEMRERRQGVVGAGGGSVGVEGEMKEEELLALMDRVLEEIREKEVGDG